MPTSHPLHLPAPSLPRPSLTFIADVCVGPSRLPTRHPATHASPLRRPRAPFPPPGRAHARRVPPRAVFLPPEGLPPVPDDDLDDDMDTDAGMSIFDDDEDDADADADGADDGTGDRGADAGSATRRGARAGDARGGDVRGGGGGGGGTYAPRVDTIHRLLAETEPEYETWQSRHAARSLTTIRGASESVLGADELNDSLRPTHLQRHRHVLAPDEAFGAIFTWDVVVANARELERRSWAVVAEERGLMPPDLDDIVRAELMAPEAAVSRVFYWTRDWGEIKAVVFRKTEVLAQLEPAFAWESAGGIHQFLAALGRHGVKCVLCATRPRATIEPVVRKLGLDEFFSKNEIVSADDEFDSMEQMLLVASLKAERPPGKCAVFTDKPATITAGHEVTSKVVGVLGTHAAYEMRTADHIVAGFDELVVYNIRRLFSEEGYELMDMQTEREVFRE